MEYLTYAQIKQKVHDRIDTEDETFVDDTEMLGYCQDAIDFCENKIHKANVGDRYFETVGPITLVAGVRDYTLPSDIFGNKITKLLLKHNGYYHEVRRLTKSDRYTAFHDIEQYSPNNNLFSYMLLNPSVNQKPVIRFTPRPNIDVATYSPTIDTTTGSKTIVVSSATGIVSGQFVSAVGVPTNSMVEKVNGTTVTISQPCTVTGTTVASTFTDPDMLCYYLRNASKPTASTDNIDIPEFSSYIIQYMVVEVLKKDSGNPRLQDEKDKLMELEQDMNSTLAEMTPDQDDFMESDCSIYEESV